MNALRVAVVVAVVAVVSGCTPRTVWQKAQPAQQPGNPWPGNPSIKPGQTASTPPALAAYDAEQARLRGEGQQPAMSPPQPPKQPEQPQPRIIMTPIPVMTAEQIMALNPTARLAAYFRERTDYSHSGVAHLRRAITAQFKPSEEDLRLMDAQQYKKPWPMLYVMMSLGDPDDVVWREDSSGSLHHTLTYTFDLYPGFRPEVLVFRATDGVVTDYVRTGGAAR